MLAHVCMGSDNGGLGLLHGSESWGAESTQSHVYADMLVWLMRRGIKKL